MLSNKQINKNLNNIMSNVKITPKIEKILLDIKYNQEKLKEINENKSKILKEYSNYIDNLS